MYKAIRISDRFTIYSPYPITLYTFRSPPTGIIKKVGTSLLSLVDRQAPVRKKETMPTLYVGIQLNFVRTIKFGGLRGTEKS